MLSNFIDYLSLERKLSPKTVEAYQNDLLQFQNFIFNHFELEELKLANYSIIRSWIVYLNENEISNKSINRKISSLNTFFKYLLKTNDITENPLIKHNSLKTPKKQQVPFSKDEVLELLSHFANLKDPTYEQARNYLLIELVYSTGIRRAELINLKIINIDFHNNQIKVFGKRSKERIIPILESLVERIKAHLTIYKHIKKSNYLFETKKGKPLYPSLLYRIINENFALVSTKLKRSPHLLRHSFATHLLDNGASITAVKELLGHESLASTEIYAKNSIEALKKAHSFAHPRNKNRG
ncbi:MAG: tyrosine-type recombinase/integrase [Psychroflexus maritimus]